MMQAILGHAGDFMYERKKSRRGRTATPCAFQENGSFGECLGDSYQRTHLTEGGGVKSYFGNAHKNSYSFILLFKKGFP